MLRDGSGVPDFGPEYSNAYVRTRAMCDLRHEEVAHDRADQL